MLRLPKDKYDITTVMALNDVDPRDLFVHIPELLTWLQDYNWPVARPLVSVLVKCNIELVPHIRHVLSSEDSIWKYWLITTLIPNLGQETQSELRGDLIRISRYPSDDERAEKVNLAAKEILG